MTDNMSRRFLQGLQNYNMSYQEILDGEWKYCGGDSKSHRNYFEIACPDTPFPNHVSKCICGHGIVENCYITNGKSIVVLGNCCVKKFIPKSMRTCERCEKPHKNRLVNRCTECRVGICDQCNTACSVNYKICYDCYIKN